MSLTLLIVDDHEGFRTFARSMLGAEGFDVTGVAADGESAIAAVHELHPDVVLLDVQLPDIDGFEVARRLAQEANGGPRIVLTSSRTASEFGTRLHDAPVEGFLVKGDLSGETLSALLAC